jgi:hypothetical protein
LISYLGLSMRLRRAGLALRRRLPGGRVAEDLGVVFSESWYRAQGGTTLRHYLRRGWREGLDPHPLFRTRWYLEAYPDVAAMRICPLVHYLEVGAHEGRNPSPAFWTWWYLQQNPDLQGTSRNPWVHYIVAGAREGRAPFPLFDPHWYCKSNPGVELADAYRHYFAEGWRAGRSPHPLFDVPWYQTAYPNAAPGRDPLEHYCAGGWREGHRPNPLFNPLWYREAYPDTHWLEPLAHFSSVGRKEGKRPSCLFDEAYYRHVNRRLNRDDDAFAHYLEHGWQKGYDPTPFFDGAWYVSQWNGSNGREPPVASIAPIGHYLLHGLRNRCNPSPLFDSAWYADAHADVPASGLDPFEHYLCHGASDGRATLARDVSLEAEIAVVFDNQDWPFAISVNPTGRNLVIVACHDQRGGYGLALRHLVRAYRAAGWLVVLSFDHALAPDAFSGIPDADRPDGVRAAAHRGYDFFSWRLAWEGIRGIDDAARVLLTNDSVIGPLSPLDHLTRLIESHSAEVLGFVESAEIMYHLQSWGLVFQGRPLTDQAARRFLAQVHEHHEKAHLIGRLEFRLARWFTLQGYAVSSISSPVSMLLCSVNPSIHGWRRVLGLGIPFVKREVFTLAAYQTRSVPADVLRELSAESTVDVVPLVIDSLAQIGIANPVLGSIRNPAGDPL